MFLSSIYLSLISFSFIIFYFTPPKTYVRTDVCMIAWNVCKEFFCWCVVAIKVSKLKNGYMYVQHTLRAAREWNVLVRVPLFAWPGNIRIYVLYNLAA